MKALSFRNSSRLIQSLVMTAQPALTEQGESFYDEDLQFSTFRSDDYQFYDHKPFVNNQETSREDSSFCDSSFELKRDDEQSQQEDEDMEKKQLSSEASTNEGTQGMRGVCFRNMSKVIRQILEGEVKGGLLGFKHRRLNFRNDRILLLGLLQCGEKEI